MFPSTSADNFCKFNQRNLMIYRFFFECPSCDTILKLRVGASFNDRPFYILCAECNALTKIRTKVHIDDDSSLPIPTAENDYESDDGKLLFPGKDIPSKHTITLHPDLPSVINSKDFDNEKDSLFTFHFSQMKNEYLNYQKRMQKINSLTKKDYSALKTLVHHYLERNWNYFYKMRKNIFHDIWENDNAKYTVHSQLPDILQAVFHPYIIDENAFKKTCLFFKNPSKIDNFKSKIKLAFAEEEMQLHQKRLLHCLELWIEKLPLMLISFPLFFYKKNNRAIKNMRIYYDDFASLRDLYENTFESCLHVMSFTIALLNQNFRKSPRKFSKKKNFNKKKITSFAEFANIRKYDDKFKFLKEDKVLYYFLKTHLQKNFRNATSHSKTFHNMETGIIESHWPAQQDVQYLFFVADCLKLIEILLFNINCIGKHYPFENVP